MGILASTARFLIEARCAGTSFEHSLTLGRQNMFVDPIRIRRLLQAAELWPCERSGEQFEREMYGSPYYAEPFFKALGATEIASLDRSDYEGATILHDLNEPIPDHLRQRFDVVCDIGTLEHVFNFPVAIASCMDMVRVGGHLILATPANNYFGHGFYQFSPELFYRLLSEERGFEVRRMLVSENDHFPARLLGYSVPVELEGDWYEVADAATLAHRTTLITRYPTQLFVLARKREERRAMATTPQQSDYVRSWEAVDRRPEVFRVSRLPFSSRWAFIKRLQLHWLPLLCRAAGPGFFWRAARRRGFTHQRDSFKKVGKRPHWCAKTDGQR